MPTADRTYSFRATGDLGDRIANARRVLTEPAAQRPEVREWINRELQRAWARWLRAAPELARDQSRFMRTTVEVMVDVAEKVARDLALADEYAAGRHEDTEADAYNAGMLELSRGAWREQ